MGWLWFHSLVLLVVTFGGGLWLGHAISAVTSGRRAAAPQADTLVTEDVYPAYHGAEPVAVAEPEPEPEPMPAVAEPPPVVAPPPILVPVVDIPPPPPVTAAVMPRIRAALLFPVNQFGVITVTQAPAI